MSDLAVPTFSHIPRQMRHDAFSANVGRPQLHRQRSSAARSSDVIQGIQQALDRPPVSARQASAQKTDRITVPAAPEKKRGIVSSILHRLVVCLCGPEI